jgi:carboxyl-terminal processing protease
MRPVVSSRAAWFLGAWLIGAIAAAWAEPPSPTTGATAGVVAGPASPAAGDIATDPDAALRHALDLERQRSWSAAITSYEHALEVWPDRAVFRHRLRLCESHYKLGRRYQDPSFKKVLLHLPRERVLELYDELLERIETHYVEPVELEPLLRKGLDNLEVALRDPVFLTANAPKAAPERVLWLRDALRAQRERVGAKDRQQARAWVVSACDLGARGVGLPPAAVVLEFVFGACDALDDYSSYLTPDKLDDLYAMIDGNFVGLGIELKLDDDGLRLVGVIQGGPAWDAGLKPGDRITHVAGLAVRGLGLDEAASRLQGGEGTRVEIAVRHPNGSEQRLSLVRRSVEVRSVSQARIVDPVAGVGYIQLTAFQKTSTEELNHAVATLQRKGLRHLILDLRGNPGGLLNVAVEIAEQFLDRGVIVSTKGRAPGQSFVYRAQGHPSWTMPLTVLIDHDSASASEILAGALKDNGRALILGQRSYGKGSVQSIFPLRSAPAGLKLTTAKFYSPRNRPYSEQGVEPDIPVHVTAKPTLGAETPTTSDLQLGDPDHDPVLERALEQAKRPVARAG